MRLDWNDGCARLRRRASGSVQSGELDDPADVRQEPHGTDLIDEEAGGRKTRRSNPGTTLISRRGE